MNSFSIFAVLLQIICGFIGGAFSFLLLNWGIYRFQLGLHHRLTECEQRVERETKIRASDASRRGKNIEQDLLDQIKTEAMAPPALTLEGWRKSKFGGSI